MTSAYQQQLAKQLHAAEARIAAVRALHQPVTGYTGWGPDDDPTPGAYGPISQACTTCGSEDDAVRWPCGTIRALNTSRSSAGDLLAALTHSVRAAQDYDRAMQKLATELGFGAEAQP
ncbi:hypothetical protein [Streptomyces sp. LS1784]|uniref:hypothetical protein n=1 Tax=Streptomyces sp. LS1784 TaxID=2851533 RepID=UPI001CC9053E|nr:hypothetical protein [Streptomyces sp. LS1784]